MRIATVFAALAALVLAPAASAAPRDEVADRMAEALYDLTYNRVAEDALVTGSSRAPFMVANPGNAAYVVIGCENNCAYIQFTLRVAGQAPLVVRTSQQTPRSLVARIPSVYTRSLSNFEFTIDANCGTRPSCLHRWVLLTRGVAQSARQRGVPAAITDTEWNAATGSVANSQIAWTSTPAAQDLRFYYPVQQWRAGQSGNARLQCLVGDRGALRCRPDGQSAFNDAALKLATRFRAPANDASGQPLANRRIVLPIRFEPQG